MTKKEIIFTTIEQQIELLKAKDILFGDEDFAKQQLQTYGYYNIINTYKSTYMKNVDGERYYAHGTTFEKLFSLFTLDHNIRTAVMTAMLDIEEHTKAVAAEIIAQQFGTDHRDYLQWRNYRDRKNTAERFRLNEILKSLNNTLNSGKNPIRYYSQEYNIIPPWILFKGIYMSTLVNFVRLFKNREKTILVKRMYQCSDELSKEKNVTNLLFDTLFICLEYRNVCAHGGRIYNYVSKHKMDSHYEENLDILNPTISEVYEKKGLPRLLILLETLNYKKPLDTITSAITEELHRHLALYPEDYASLADELDIKIFLPMEDVIIKNGKEYHFESIHSSDGTIFLKSADDFDLFDLMNAEEN